MHSSNSHSHYGELKTVKKKNARWWSVNIYSVSAMQWCDVYLLVKKRILLSSNTSIQCDSHMSDARWLLPFLSSRTYNHNLLLNHNFSSLQPYFVALASSLTFVFFLLSLKIHIHSVLGYINAAAFYCMHVWFSKFNLKQIKWHKTWNKILEWKSQRQKANKIWW